MIKKIKIKNSNSRPITTTNYDDKVDISTIDTTLKP